MKIEKFKSAGIFTNRKRDADLSKTAFIRNVIERCGKNAVLPDFADDDSILDEKFYNQVDFILTLGGDGTILSAASDAARYGIPIMGVNIGNLGYLTDCSFDDAEKSLQNVFNGSYILERRMMLSAEIITESGERQEQTCLNDVCITRGVMSKIIRFDLFINDNFVDNYNADGIIISTPTGSTAYNLSAGGPILNPNSEMIAITPICPHMLTTRPIVVSSNDKISVKIATSSMETIATPDGRQSIVLNVGDVVNVEKSYKSVNIIKTNGMDFYSILRKKIIGINAVDF